jgi:hypothetical protein
VNAPVQFSEFAPLIVTVDPVAPPVMVNEAQLAAVLIVIVRPTLIVTASEAVGVAADPATPPVVVAQIGSFQFPLATAKRCPATSRLNNPHIVVSKIKCSDLMLGFICGISVGFKKGTDQKLVQSTGTGRANVITNSSVNVINSSWFNQF